MPRNSNGFTLVELLITVVIIGILAGIVISVLNPQRQRQRAQDGVRAGNIAKLAQALEAYNAGEGSYPATFDSTNVYVQSWPAESATEDYQYAYVSTSPTWGCLTVQMATDTLVYFKYFTSSYTNDTYAGRVSRNCSSRACSGVAALSACSPI